MPAVVVVWRASRTWKELPQPGQRTSSGQASWSWIGLWRCGQRQQGPDGGVAAARAAARWGPVPGSAAGSRPAPAAHPGAGLGGLEACPRPTWPLPSVPGRAKARAGPRHVPDSAGRTPPPRDAAPDARRRRTDRQSAQTNRRWRMARSCCDSFDPHRQTLEEVLLLVVLVHGLLSGQAAAQAARAPTERYPHLRVRGLETRARGAPGGSGPGCPACPQSGGSLASRRHH